MKKIPLTNGGETLVDDEDYDFFNRWRWVRNGRGYVHRGIKRTDRTGTSLSLHREIAEANKGELVDHIDGNTLNNQRANLRICTHKENTANKKLSINNKTGYKGVTVYKNQWRAMIATNDARIHIGLYDDIVEAALAYDCAAIQLFGDYANLNIL